MTPSNLVGNYQHYGGAYFFLSTLCNVATSCETLVALHLMY